MRIGELCAGYGGLALSLGDAPTWVAETDPAASAVVANHHPDAPNLGDVTRVDWTTTPPVDVITAGFPCQPFSAAGRRLGADDERHLWPSGILPAIATLRPPTVLLENVPGLLTVERGRVWRRILDDLIAIGYAARWAVVGACHVGAPHHRHRLFVVVTEDDPGPPDGALFGTPVSCFPSAWRSGYASDGMVWPLPAARWLVCGVAALLPTPLARDASRGAGFRNRSEGHPLSEVAALLDAGRWGRYAAAIAHWEEITGTAAPDPVQVGPRGGRLLAPPFVEWLMGVPAGWVTGVRGVGREAQLRMLGNGVVPVQAALAWALLGSDPHTTIGQEGATWATSRSSSERTHGAV